MLGNSCFSRCENLVRITFGEQSKLNSIEGWAFWHCNLAEIEIPNAVTTMAGSCFADCRGLTRVIFGANSQLTRIDSWAFHSCQNLAEIRAPNRVAAILKKVLHQNVSNKIVTF